MEKKQARLDTFFGKKRRRLDEEDIAPTADAADNNVDDSASGAASDRASGPGQDGANDNLVVVNAIDIGMVAGNKAVEVCLTCCLRKNDNDAVTLAKDPIKEGNVEDYKEMVWHA